MGFNTISDKLFGGHNNVRPKPFIAPDADIVDAKFTVLDEKTFIYTQNSQNNPENSEGFFTQAGDRDFPKSAHPSHTVAQFYAAAASDRSLGNRSTKYGPSGSSSFGSSNRELGRQFAFSA